LLAGFLAGAAVLIRFNVRTYRLQNLVREAARKEGKDWSMWGDLHRMTSFLLRPGALIEETDSTAVRLAKEMLLKHRGRMNREILKGIALLIVGALLGIAVGISPTI
jgi:hypothetical protein